MIAPLVLLVITMILRILLRADRRAAGADRDRDRVAVRDPGSRPFVFLEVGSRGVDASLPTFAFIFLVALGVDYNIFLMSRVREEARRHGTDARA